METISNQRNNFIKASINVEYFSIAWMTFEFLVAFYSSAKANSILLLAFGLDSLLEIISGTTLIWRLKKEVKNVSERAIKKAEQRSSLIVGTILLLLSAYIALISFYNLLSHQAARSSFSGIVIALASIILMPFLTFRKRFLGEKLASVSLKKDGMCNITCAYMAGTVLVGTLLTFIFDWWWADSIFALMLVYFIDNEGYETFQEATKAS
ncbi:cation transporter [Oenococcus oeni]|uniref:cation transporter n=1 Tax=Oenococcus oeni TaxID=1247 RepID=UPI00050F77D9|nr:cation transporter [Oenococcus oeni]KGO16813.1 cation transporter [Oenococcus oeni X2L]KGH56658.1 cation transporter [Oenococcus oeni S22]KGH79700.1 cation transporter [Oenococcus oeni IOEB_0607]KGH89679.1 cation transporter [Oenococcus oeni IOEB_L26_1]OIK62278.1 cation transporter [Oenococcus oeni]